MSQKCKNCAYYNPLYSKGVFVFWRENKGICRRSEEKVEENERCGLHALAEQETITVQMLDSAIQDIKRIEEILGVDLSENMD